MTTAVKQSARYYGWRVVWAAFVLAIFGWGIGFYGPPVFLHALREARGWPLAVVSAAMTMHFLIGAVVAEIAAGSAGAGSGLAYRIAESGYRLNIPRMFAALLLLAVAGVAIFFVLSAISHLALRRWHESAISRER